VRLELLWEGLTELIQHLDPDCAYHEPRQFTQSPCKWALVARRRSELEVKMKADPSWPAGGQWQGNRVLEARRIKKGADWLKKTVEAEWREYFGLLDKRGGKGGRFLL